MDITPYRVLPGSLRWRCDPNGFTFSCTDELVPRQEFIGQDRAVRAIDFGLNVAQPGYNVFVTGMAGTGKASVIKAHLEELVAKQQAAPGSSAASDWCYVHNFVEPDKAKAMQLPAGRGKALKADLERLEEVLRAELHKAFTSKEYEAERKKIIEAGQKLQQQIFAKLQEAAYAEGMTVQFSPMGIAILALIEDHPVTDEELLHMREPRLAAAVQQKRERLMGRVQEALSATHSIDHATRDKIEELDRRVAEVAMGTPFSQLAKQYDGLPQALSFIQALKEFTASHADVFLGEESYPHTGPLEATMRAVRQRETLLPYVVNVFVDNSETKGPPIIVETNPTFANLFGRIERRFLMGAYVTDHTLLRPGALQLANNGYLILDIRSVLTNPLSWETLKRAIKTKALRPEDASEALGIVLPQSVRPEPIPLNLKVIMTGEPLFYQLLSAFDEEFWETFKVRADFDDQIERQPSHLDSYAAFICSACHRQRLRHLESAAVAKVAEYGARLVADQGKLSTRFGLLNDLLIEADYWAGKDNAKMVSAAHVEQALVERVYRSNLIRERLDELTRKGIIKIAVDGSRVGQLNGLAVYSAGDVAFGRPARITAKTFLGRAGIINIEREAALSGKAHNKGVLIIGGYLGSKYAQERPLSVSATIAFEQSYDDIEGDSASSAEVFALLSSLADVPLRQDIAVTGSVDQNGEVQAIGGINQKIEGFFDTCKIVGLTGRQGVIIPKQNVQNLMLRQDVVQAAAAGQFHIYAIGTIDEGIQILTGLLAGERDVGGKFPLGSLNFLVEQRLTEYVVRLQKLGAQNGLARDVDLSRQPLS